MANKFTYDQFKHLIMNQPIEITCIRIKPTMYYIWGTIAGYDSYINGYFGCVKDEGDYINYSVDCTMYLFYIDYTTLLITAKDDEDNVIYEDNKCSCDKHLPVNY